jgi:Recombination endonuclease VII
VYVKGHVSNSVYARYRRKQRAERRAIGMCAYCGILPSSYGPVCIRCKLYGWKNVKKLGYWKGITPREYFRMLVKQDFKCQICRKETLLRMDHNHSTGIVRGLLCNSCNVGIGYFYENIEYMLNAVKYLRRN